MSLQKVFEQEAGTSGRNGSCNQGEIVARQARMTFGANAVPCPPSEDDDDDVLRRRRSICSCPSAQVFNLIIGLSIFSRKGRKSKEQLQQRQQQPAKLKQLAAQFSLGCSLVSQIVPRQFSEAFDIMFGRGYSSSVSSSSASVFLPLPPLISGILRASRPVSPPRSGRSGLARFGLCHFALGLGVFCILIAVAKAAATRPGRGGACYWRNPSRWRTSTGFPAGCAALHSRCTSIRAVIDVADITAVPQWVPSMFEIWRSD